MKLKPKKRQSRVEFQEEVREEVKPRKKSENKLPPDEYPNVVFEKILVRQADSFRQYLEISVKRYENDEENPYMCQITMAQESERYTGRLNGKTIYLPIESVIDLIDTLSEVLDECEEKDII